jgi:hypothetical protein
VKRIAVLLPLITLLTTHHITMSMQIESSSSSTDDGRNKTKTLLQQIQENSIYQNQRLKNNQKEIAQFNKFVTQSICSNVNPNANIFGSTKPKILLYGINSDIFECTNQDHCLFLNQTLNECVIEESNYDLIAILSKIHDKYMNKITLPQETNDLISKQLKIIQKTGTQSFNTTIFPALNIHVDDIQQRVAYTLSLANNFLQEEDKKLAAALYFANLPNNQQYTQPDIDNHEKVALQTTYNKLAKLLPELQTLSEFITLTIKNDPLATELDRQPQQ